MAERCFKASSVRSMSHAPPCAQSIDRLTTPQTKAKGLRRAKKLPVYSERKVLSKLKGIPKNKLPKATPNTSAGTAPPMHRPQSQELRHLVFSSLER